MNFIKRVFFFLARKGLTNWIPDKLYLKICFRLLIGYRLDLNNPKTYNEKLQWLKLYNRKPEYTDMVDKQAVKKIVGDIIGEEYIIPTLAVYDSAEEIDFDKLPNQFVLKCTHDSGGIVICDDKSKLDIEAAKKTLSQYLHRDFFHLWREWPYKNVPHKIIAEEYMVDESGYELKDYKFFCFDGKMKASYIATDRNSDEETKFDFFDRDFNLMPFTNGHPNSGKSIKKPQNYEKMIELAETLSKGIPQVRIDFYNINGKIYFGEVTLFHMSGLAAFDPFEYDELFGSWITLPNK